METTVRCLINYTAPDGAVYVAGETYAVTEEQVAQLTAGAPGYFAVEARKAKEKPARPPFSAPEGDWMSQQPRVDEPLDQPQADRQAAKSRKT